MSAYSDSLNRIRTQIVAQLEEMASSPKPDYGVGGVSVSWGAHWNNLWKALEDIETRLARADQPYWKISKARP